MKDENNKEYVYNYLHDTIYDNVVISNCDVAASLKSTKSGKACDVDGLSAEHFSWTFQLNIFANDYIYTVLSIVFNTFIFLKHY